MRILLVSQHYAPEVTAAVPRVRAFAEGLAARGHQVEVICALPNHPSGIVEEAYRGRRTVVRELNGVTVRHVWLRPSPRKTTANRLLTYGSFAASALLAGSRAARPDAVIASSPPLPVGAVAAALARRNRSPWVFDVRDLWPEAAVVLGELRGERAIRIAQRLERCLYRSADAIVTVTEPFRREIAPVCGEPGKVVVISNGTTRTWLDAGERAPDREAAGLRLDEFVWAYGGNVGLGQGMESAVEAAAMLGEGFRLLIVGGGPRLDAVMERARALPAAAVEFRPLMDPAPAAALLRCADALLVPLAALPELSKFVPSKLFDCCALGRPVLVAAAGEPQRLVARAGAGVPVPPEDPRALAEAVWGLREDPERAARLGASARRFAAENLRERGVERLEALLEGLVPGPA